MYSVKKFVKLRGIGGSTSAFTTEQGAVGKVKATKTKLTTEALASKRGREHWTWTIFDNRTMFPLLEL
jgi:hypothetical protein